MLSQMKFTELLVVQKQPAAWVRHIPSLQNRPILPSFAVLARVCLRYAWRSHPGFVNCLMRVQIAHRTRVNTAHYACAAQDRAQERISVLERRGVRDQLDSQQEQPSVAGGVVEFEPRDREDACKLRAGVYELVWLRIRLDVGLGH